MLIDFLQLCSFYFQLGQGLDHAFPITGPHADQAVQIIAC
jgi:hypothetical protein